MIPEIYRASGFADFVRPGRQRGRRRCRQPAPRRVLPRPHPHHAAVRQRRLRRHALQGPAGGRLRHPAQQDLAQHACWCRSNINNTRSDMAHLIKAPWRDISQRDRASNWARAARAPARRSRHGCRSLIERRARTCRTSAASTTRSARDAGERDAGRRHAHRLLRGLRSEPRASTFALNDARHRPAGSRMAPSWSRPSS